MFNSWLPENVSTYGGDIDWVIRMITVIVGVWFIISEVVLFSFILKYRRRKGGKSVYQPGKTWKAMSWVLIPTALVLCFDLGIDVAQSDVWTEIKIELPENPEQRIKITGRQFVWQFVLPGKDNQLGTEDDIETMNQLYVPINAKIVFELESQDVLHSFWIPNLRLKQDAVPGRTIKGWFEVTKEGTYTIGCAEICGSGHGIMRGQMMAMNSQDYQNWMDEYYADYFEEEE